MRIALMFLFAQIGFSQALLAAGGHHAVDDAAMLAPGQCHVESWIDRQRGGAGAWTVAPACHALGAEWSLSLTRASSGTAGALLEPQIKWATASPWTRLDLGFALALLHGVDGGDERGLRVLLPATLALGERASLHLNLGHERLRGEGGARIWGASVETTLAPRWDGVIERFGRQSEGPSTQFGLRWHAIPDALSLDLSHAVDSGAARERRWILGLTWMVTR